LLAEHLHQRQTQLVLDYQSDRPVPLGEAQMDLSIPSAFVDREEAGQRVILSASYGDADRRDRAAVVWT
jgi:hypothetical protein